MKRLTYLYTRLNQPEQILSEQMLIQIMVESWLLDQMLIEIKSLEQMFILINSLEQILLEEMSLEDTLLEEKLLEQMLLELVFRTNSHMPLEIFIRIKVIRTNYDSTKVIRIKDI